MDQMFTVFIVDDDDRIIKALSRLMRVKGYDVRSYTSPRNFLANRDAMVPGCAVFDVSMPGLDGLELQQALATKFRDAGDASLAPDQLKALQQLGYIR